MSEEVEVDDHEVEVDELVEQRERVQSRLQDAKERASQHGTTEGFIKRVEASPDGKQLTFTVETAGDTFKFNLHVLSPDDGVVKSERARAFEEQLDADIEVPDSFVGERVLVRYSEDEPEHVVPPTSLTEAAFSAGVLTVGVDGRVAPAKRGRIGFYMMHALVLAAVGLTMAVSSASAAVAVLGIGAAVSFLPYAVLLLLKRRNAVAFV